ncbi:hypothetical protein AJ80_08174 [Polytolypa hystricis UAMH7299]|uniref:Inhibitor I9 domain-containing protein n=1 Tax=Polytolypa hystricis (strain UAMH7299) TaxID=1447883 RepID=A0A2B7XBT6_POLH7|nr:hypothetical protein AJ80_08174 [Polytolypa hystricis UAMH7299]
MKLFLHLILTFLLAAFVAAGELKDVIVTYPADTPDTVLDQAKSAIKDAGGIITHEYNLIKGFAAKASAQALQTVSALGSAYNPYIEENVVISVGPGNGNGPF